MPGDALAFFNVIRARSEDDLQLLLRGTKNEELDMPLVEGAQ